MGEIGPESDDGGGDDNSYSFYKFTIGMNVCKIIKKITYDGMNYQEFNLQLRHQTTTALLSLSPIKVEKSSYKD